MKIFVCIESYLPGTLGGGPVRALANLIDHLGDAHEFFIFTRNHDYLSAEPYTDIEPNVWHQQSQASIYYSDTGQVESSLLEEIKAVQPDWLYLNGALPALTRTFLRLRQTVPSIQKIPVLLAPHGNLSVSALAHHRFRKQAWLLYAKARGLYQDLIWHAASEREADQVRAVFGAQASIREVPMAPRKVEKWKSGKVEKSSTLCRGKSGAQPVIQKAPLFDEEGWAAQRVGMPAVALAKEGVVPDSSLSSQPSALNPQVSALHLVYFGRLSPEKNLSFAFLLLKQFAAQHPERRMIYDLIGSGEPRYEAKLWKLAARLPATVKVNFIGQLTPEALQARLHPQTPPLGEEGCPKGGVVPSPPSHLPTFPPSHLVPPSHASRYHAMLMPSLTENFSYTVLESLQAGIPVLISDQTPWRDLQSQGVGWDLSLKNHSGWEEALRFLCGQTCVARREQFDCVRRYAQQWAADYSDRAMQLFGTNGDSHL